MTRGSPFIWEPERRFALRSEIDAAYFHLYGISRGDTEYIMDTFPVVRDADARSYSEFRTKRVYSKYMTGWQSRARWPPIRIAAWATDESKMSQFRLSSSTLRISVVLTA